MKTSWTVLPGLLTACFLISGCPVDSDDDDATSDDDDSAASDDDDATSDDDDSAPSDDDDSAPPEALELQGSWIDNWGGLHAVEDGRWTSGTAPTRSSYVITQFSNSERYLVAENSAANAWAAGLWSRFDWTWVGDDLYYCQTAYDAADEAAALATPAADASDPASAGCGASSWSSLSEHQGAVALNGVFHDSWGTFHVIFQEGWHQGGLSSTATRFQFSQYSNAEGWAVAQNGAGNSWAPGAWSRFDWLSDGSSWWYCQTAYDAVDEAAALATPAADPGEPSTAGCGGSPWTELGSEAGFVPIQGFYTDEWGADHAVTWDNWTQGDSTWALVQWNGEQGWTVALNGEENTFAPGLWSRFDWTWSGEDLYFCQTAYDVADQEAALATPAADATDPAASGCGDYPWTHLNP